MATATRVRGHSRKTRHGVTRVKPHLRHKKTKRGGVSAAAMRKLQDAYLRQIVKLPPVGEDVANILTYVNFDRRQTARVIRRSR